MIGRSILSAVFFFLAYNLVLSSKRVRDSCVVQSQWQGNLIKAEEYAAQIAPQKWVIIGSSMAARLPALTPDCYDLCLTGDGPLTGLEVINRSGKLPQVLLIEINHVLREENVNLINSVFRPALGTLRPTLFALQSRYQPANLISGNVEGGIVARGFRLFGRIPGLAVANPKIDPERERENLKYGLSAHRLEFDISPDPTLLRRQVIKIKTVVDVLAKRGVRCVLLEMPSDPSLEDLSFPRDIRRAVQTALPPEDYDWVGPDLIHRYATTDGVHLPNAEAEIFAAHIRSEIRKFSWAK